MAKSILWVYSVFLASHSFASQTWRGVENENNQQITFEYQRDDQGQIRKNKIAFLNESGDWQYYAKGKNGGYNVIKNINGTSYEVNFFEQEGQRKLEIVSIVGSEGLREVNANEIPKGAWLTEKGVDGKTYGYRMTDVKSTPSEYVYVNDEWRPSTFSRSETRAWFGESHAKDLETQVGAMKQEADRSLQNPNVQYHKTNIQQGRTTPVTSRFYNVAAANTPSLPGKEELVHQLTDRTAFANKISDNGITSHPVGGIEVNPSQPLLIMRAANEEDAKKIEKMLQDFTMRQTKDASDFSFSTFKHGVLKADFNGAMQGLSGLGSAVGHLFPDQVRLYIDASEQVSDNLNELYAAHSELAASVAAVASDKGYAMGAARADKIISKKNSKGKNAPIAERRLSQGYGQIAAGAQEAYAKLIDAGSKSLEAGLWRAYSKASSQNPHPNVDVNFLLDNKESREAKLKTPGGAAIRYPMGNDFYYLQLHEKAPLDYLSALKTRLDRLHDLKRLTPETAEEAEVASLRQAWKLSEPLAEKLHALIQQEQKQAEALGQTYFFTNETALKMIADLRSNRPPYVASNDQTSLRRVSRPTSVRTTGAETHVPGE